LICENRDDDVALQFHSKVRLPFHPLYP
jgi:hypothetical protein